MGAACHCGADGGDGRDARSCAPSGGRRGAARLLAFAGGLSVPPVGPTLRTLLPGLVGRERLDTAFALESLEVELAFVLGPLLAAGLAAAISPELGYLTGVALLSAGPSGWPPTRRRVTGARRGRARAAARARCRCPGCGSCSSRSRCRAVSLGVLEIGIPAFAEENGTRDDSGWLFALWGAGSLTGGLWYAHVSGARPPTCASSRSPRRWRWASRRSRWPGRCPCSPPA